MFPFEINLNRAFDFSSAGIVPDLTLLRTARRAMATEFEVILPVDTHLGMMVAQDLLDQIDDLESQLTVYRDDSEVSLLNQLAYSKPIQVESRLFGLFELAASITRETEGAFDITTGALIKAWGFYARQGRVPSVPERSDALSRCGMRHVVLERENRLIRFLREGLEINLGAIGKGFALDEIARRAREQWKVDCALLHGGSSSVLALGKPSKFHSGWPVMVKHPWRTDQELGIVHLRDEAMGTSAATHQFFEYNGRKLGHLLDPRTGWPAERWNQVSVIAPTAAQADALSTALFVLGPEASREYLRTHPEIGAIALPLGDEARPESYNLRRDQFLPRNF